MYKPHLTPNMDREIHGMLGEVYGRIVQEFSTLNLLLFQICKAKWRVRFILGQLAAASQTYLQFCAKDKQFEISTSRMKTVRPPWMHSMQTLPGVDRHFMVSLINPYPQFPCRLPSFSLPLRGKSTLNLPFPESFPTED